MSKRFGWLAVLRRKISKMSEKNKSILLKGNAAISAGNHEGFLELCTEDTVWEFVGERTLMGKKEVRAYMAETYLDPPRLNVSELIAEGNFVTAVGEIQLKDKDGNWTSYWYCDIWRFEGGKMAALRGFVIKK